MATSTESGSGPVDGGEIRLDIAPHHEKHPHKKENSIINALFTGAAVVGGVVGLYLLYKHFFGKKKEENKDGKLRKRSEFKVSEVEEEIKAVYTSALEDEGFLDFLEEIQDAGLFDEFEG